MELFETIAPTATVHGYRDGTPYELTIMAIFKEKTPSDGPPSVLLWKGVSKLQKGSPIFAGSATDDSTTNNSPQRIGILDDASEVIGSQLSKLFALIRLDPMIAKRILDTTETAKLSENVAVKVHSHNVMRVKTYPALPSQNKERDNSRNIKPSKRGSLIGQAYNVAIKVEDESVTAPVLSVVKGRRQRTLTSKYDNGSPILSFNSKKLFGFVVGHDYERDFILNAEDVAASGEIEFLSQRRIDLGYNIWDFRRVSQGS
jgi:hypothetical protein